MATNAPPSSVTNIHSHPIDSSNNNDEKSKMNVIGEYVVGKTLGQGSFGKVKLGTHYLTKKKVALKLIEHGSASPKDLINIEREIKIMYLLDHPNIVKLHDVIELEDKKTTCLVLEYIEGGELFDYIVANRRLKEPEACRFFRQIISAMEYCHSNLVVHRDLKPENLLLDSEKNIKINDFGLSNVMKPGNFLYTYCGSPLYSSPEIILETSYLGPEVDIWALGVILYAMVTGYLPWDGDEVKEQVKNAVKANYEVPDHVSSDCKYLISRMLTVDPKKRATIAEVRESAWVNKGFTSPPPSCLPTRTALSADKIDQEIIEKMRDLNFDKNDVIADLISGILTSPNVVMYFLMLDQKIRQQPTSPASNSNRKPSILTSIPEVEEGENGGSPSKSPVANVAATSNRPKSMHLHANSAFLPSAVSSGSSSPSSMTPPGSPKTGAKNKMGILNIFKKKDVSRTPDVNAGREERKSNRRSYDPEAVVEWKQEGEDDGLRVVKGAFNFETTTTKPLDQIQAEIERALTKRNMVWKVGKKGCSYKVKVERPKVKMEIEICKIEKMEGLRGIKFKRSGGDTWEYKTLYQTICTELKL